MQLTKFLCVFTLVCLPFFPVAEAKKKFATVSTPGKGRCPAAIWPYSRQQSAVDFQNIFLLTPRPVLEQYLLGEVTAEKLEQSPVSYQLATFLIDTESDKQKKGFYGLIRWGAELSNPKNKPLRMKLENVCEMRKKIVGS